MAFPNILLKHVYNSEKDDLLEDFYIPVLSQANDYWRITGYFSSSSFRVAAKGIANFLENNGKMQFILNVQLMPEDYKAIHEGLNTFEEKISLKIMGDLNSIQDSDLQNHVAILGYLVANGILEIRIGYLKSEMNGMDILHQKVGILRDIEGNILTFSGSNNESAMGWKYNSEKFKVFFSWQDNPELYESDISDFEELWLNKSPRTRVIPFPEAAKNHIIRLSPKSSSELEMIIYEVESAEIRRQEEQESDLQTGYEHDDTENTQLVNEKQPSFVTLREYQHEAIKSWFRNGKCGIFEMATGTGKTVTSIGVLLQMLREENTLVTIISCPYLHLCNQWQKSIREMGLTLPIIQASSINSKWKDEVMGMILDQKLGKANQFLILTTHDTISSDSFIDIMNEIREPIFLIGDEIHGMGSSKRLEGLQQKFQYRLGLSATPERYMDEEGTDELMQYFEGISYSFDLGQAITEINPETGLSYLTPYEYHPIFVELKDEDFEEYDILSGKIAILMNRNNRNEKENKTLEQLLIKRQNIIKNSSTKYPAFSVILSKLQEDDKLSHTLVYCSPQQIEATQDVIRSISGIYQHRFTNREDAKKKRDKYHGMTEREYLLSNFDNGNYHVLVAIRCLDEGVDVPSTQIAILMASSGNPKEYIQRRGRVLRRYPGKDKATIYDIGVLPNPLSGGVSNETAKKLIGKELKRVRIFGQDALNCSDICEKIREIEDKFELGDINEK